MRHLLIICVALSLVVCSYSQEHEEAYPRHYSEGGITLERKTENSPLQVTVNDTVDCYGDCPSVNRCLLGVCFGVCFDSNKDYHISEEELQVAFNSKLGLIERDWAGSVSKYIRQFDGADGSKLDGRISPNELQSVKDACKSFARIHDYLCARCERFSTYLERHPNLLTATAPKHIPI